MFVISWGHSYLALRAYPDNLLIVMCIPFRVIICFSKYYNVGNASFLSCAVIYRAVLNLQHVNLKILLRYRLPSYLLIPVRVYSLIVRMTVQPAVIWITFHHHFQFMNLWKKVCELWHVIKQLFGYRNTKWKVSKLYKRHYKNINIYIRQHHNKCEWIKIFRN